MRRLLYAVLGMLIVASLALAVSRGLLFFDSGDTSSPASGLSDQCDDVPDDAIRLTLTGRDGFKLGAALVGPDDAEVGLVLRQGSSQTICDWLPFAGRVAEETGARVLLFDRRGRGSSPGEPNLSQEASDTLIAVNALSDNGPDKVALAASSMGNSVMFSALSDVTPCVAISISPVLTSSDGSGVVDGSTLRGLPDNVWVTWETGNSSVVANAERIADKAGMGGVVAQTLPVSTDDHSIALVENHPEVQDFFLDAVRSCSSR